MAAFGESGLSKEGMAPRFTLGMSSNPREADYPEHLVNDIEYDFNSSISIEPFYSFEKRVFLCIHGTANATYQENLKV